MARNPYEILGLDPSASREEVRKTYRKLVKENHPDLGGSERRFEEIQEAYERILNGGISDADRELESLAPYLTPDRVFWDGPPYEPITVTLAVRGGLGNVEEFGPDRLSGDFWELPEANIETVMAGDELCRMTFVPAIPAIPPRETGSELEHLDEVGLFVNNELVRLELGIRLKDSARAKTSSAGSIGGRSAEAGEVKSTPAPMPSAAPELGGLFLLLAHAAPVGALVAQAGLQNPGEAAAIPIWIVGFGCGLTAWAIARGLIGSRSDWLGTYLDTPIPYLIVGFLLWLIFGFALYS